MASYDINLNVRAPAALRDAFYTKCGKGKDKPSVVLRRLMRDFAEGRITYTPTISAPTLEK